MGAAQGWVESGETHEMAACVIREETGVEGEIDADLDSIEYWFLSREDQVRIHKVVHFFLVRYVSGDTSQHDHEVAEAGWFGVGSALDRMTYRTSASSCAGPWPCWKRPPAPR